jgi:type IV secretory pathway VirB10-like protein
MAEADPLSPDASPSKVPVRSGVRRVNNMPLVLVAVSLAIFLGVMILVAADRAAKQRQAPAKAAEKSGGDATRSARDIIGDRHDGVVQAKPPSAPALPGGPVAVAPQDPGAPLALPAPHGMPLPPERDENAERIRLAKLARLEEAARARTRVQMEGSRSSSSPIGFIGAPASRDDALARLTAAQQQASAALASDPTAAYRARVAQLQGAGLVPPGVDGGAGGGIGSMGGSSASPLLAAAGRSNDLSQFNGNGADRWRLDSEVQAPRSPYELRAGFVIPATLISGISSDLPGQIVAQVSQDVYDTATGKFKLVPQGSRLVGTYSSNAVYGQSRVLVAWQRIVFPDGKALDIGSMPGADGTGYAGFKDSVDNHYVRIFGSALLMSGVVAGVAYSQDRNTTGSVTAPTAGSALSEALGQQLGQVTAQMISKNLNIAPTLEIRPGFRFNVIVVKDLAFSKPYASFDY